MNFDNLRKKELWIISGVAAGSVIIGVGRAVNTPFSHDEHQFIASGQVLARQGLLPFIDYPYLHLPYLTFVYGLLFLFTHHHYLIARIFSALCVTASLILVSFIARDKSNGNLANTALFAVLIQSASALAFTTEGISWNHASSISLTLIGIVIYINYTKSQRGLLLLLSGLFIGLATGTRAICVLYTLPFVVDIASQNSQSIRFRMRLLTIWGLGFAIALLPILFLFLSAPYQFWYGNITYPRLNTIYRAEQGFASMNLPGKFGFLGEMMLNDPMVAWVSIIVGMLLLKIVFDYLANQKAGREGSFFFLLIVSAFIGALAPTPSWKQYFYAPFFFSILFIQIAVQNFSLGKIRMAYVITISTGLLALLTPTFWNTVNSVKKLNSPSDWTTTRIENMSTEIANLTPDGPILTLAPSFVMEGQKPIYPQFTVGPFAWRTSNILSVEGRERYSIISPLELDAYLSNNKPGAILIGFEETYEGFSNPALGSLETPFLLYAEENGYHLISEKISWNGQSIRIYVQKRQP